MTATQTSRTLLSLADVATVEAAALAAARAEGGLVPANGPTFATQTPVHIGMVTLIARNLDRLADFYRDVIGLAVQERGAGHVRMGAGGVPLLLLLAAPDARAEAPGSAGLYHTAFLMPTRKDLARWLVHVARHRVPLTGFADHFVSEAIYLDDPEGNGIEVYADRPADVWSWSGDRLKIGTAQLDMQGLLAETNSEIADYAGAPDRMRLGHLHLRVGDVGKAQAFYGGGVGMDMMATMPRAAFMASGGYHHHLGLNTWQSAGAGQRAGDAAGLGWFSLNVTPEEMARAEERLAGQGIAMAPVAGGFETADPWGTKVRFIAA